MPPTLKIPANQNAILNVLVKVNPAVGDVVKNAKLMLKFPKLLMAKVKDTQLVNGYFVEAQMITNESGPSSTGAS